MSDQTLTLPGTIPGLLRRCSPVVFRSGGHVPGVVVKFADHKGTTDVPTVWWEPNSDPNGLGKPSTRSSILLDLTDATGRAHAAWWLLEQPSVKVTAALVALNQDRRRFSVAVDACCGVGRPFAWTDAKILVSMCNHIANQTP